MEAILSLQALDTAQESDAGTTILTTTTTSTTTLTTHSTWSNACSTPSIMNCVAWEY